METKLFDREMKYTTVDAELPVEMTGRKVYVCTVRQQKMKDIALGNLYWLLQGLKAHRRGAQMVVTDFYDRKGSSNEGIRKIMEILKMDGDENIHFRRAEDVPRNQEAWQRVVSYIRAHKDDRDTLPKIGTIGAGIDAVLAGTDDTVPENMERFLEELSVWVESVGDPAALQMFNHEEETTGWVRLVYPEAEKEFWRVALPMVNEYRGKYRDVLGGGKIIQRRLQDLPEKLAMGENGDEPSERIKFYKILFHDLIEACRWIIEKDIQDCPEPYNKADAREILAMLAKIDPRFIPFFIERCDTDSISNYQLERNFEIGDGYMQALNMIARAAAKGEKPSLDRLVPLAPFLGQVAENLGAKSGSNLNAILVSGVFSAEDLCGYWQSFITHANLRSSYFWGHPVIDLIVAKRAEVPDLWRNIRSRYIQGLVEMFPALKDAENNPLMSAIIDELKRENPTQLFEIAQSKCDGYWPRSSSNNRMVAFFLQKYLESGDTHHKNEVQKILSNIGMGNGMDEDNSTEGEDDSYDDFEDDEY